IINSDAMKSLTSKEQQSLLKLLKERFEATRENSPNIEWQNVESKLNTNPEKLWSLNEMDRTGGEPSLLDYDKELNLYLFCDFSKESPKDRRSLCYDKKAWDSRKKF